MKERIITAICLLAILLPLIYLGGYWFIGLGLVATGIATWEMMAMHDHGKEKKIPLWIKGITFIGTLLIVFVPTFRGSNFYDAQFISIAFAGALIVLNAIRIKLGQENISLYPLIIFYIGFSFRALLETRSHSLILFIFLIAIVILTDSAAYFAGRAFGKRKLAPKISPNKTIEGAIGGWLAGALFAVAFGLMNNLFAELWILIILATCLPILSQLGDLLASAMKRKYGIKDYGKIFPGHGGVMDRIDSQMLAALLIYAIIQMGGV